MKLGALDVVVFLAFYAVVLGVSMFKSRREETGEDFFLAGRGLIWPMIGLSLIAANISTEHFVGMAGQGAGIAGMAIASYEWMAAITLVVVAFFFLPKFLRSGIFTIPEYLEYRYNAAARAIMAFYTMAIYVGVTIAAVIYSGGLTLQTLFGDIENPGHLLYGVLTIGIIAGLYTIWGGLKAVAWADLFQGSALIIGGVITMILGFKAIGVKTFFSHNADKLAHDSAPGSSGPALDGACHRPLDPEFLLLGPQPIHHPENPGRKSLRQGQLGIIFAALLKLIIPFIIICPGIMAFQLYGDRMTGTGGTDAAYPLLIRNLVGPGARAFIFAAISGAVISSLASMLNSASTIFTMDLYKRLFRRDAGDKALIRTGRLSTLAFVTIGCLIAPQLGRPSFKGIFTYIQEFQGYVSPGILAVFIFGLLVKKAPPMTGVTGLVLTVPIYGALQLIFPQVAFLNRMAVTFVAILIVLAVMTALKPLAEPRVLPVRENYDMRPSRAVVFLGVFVVVATLALYAIFW
jgi:solute:Na+ symporter, SSS family